jgi:hypothetical protein
VVGDIATYADVFASYCVSACVYVKERSLGRVVAGTKVILHRIYSDPNRVCPACDASLPLHQLRRRQVQVGLPGSSKVGIVTPRSGVEIAPLLLLVFLAGIF